MEQKKSKTGTRDGLESQKVTGDIKFTARDEIHEAAQENEKM